MLKTPTFLSLIFLVSFCAHACEKPSPEWSFNYQKDNVTKCKTIVEKSTDSESLMMANYYLGLAYLSGQGVERSQQDAIEYLKVSESLEHRESLKIISVLYTNDKAIKNDKLALTYLRKLAALDDSFGLFNLGRIYYEGTVVESNIVKAKDYLSRSSAPAAVTLLEKIKSEQQPATSESKNDDSSSESSDTAASYSPGLWTIVFAVLCVFMLMRAFKETKRISNRGEFSVKTFIGEFIFAWLDLLSKPNQSASSNKPQQKKTQQFKPQPSSSQLNMTVKPERKWRLEKYHCAWCQTTTASTGFINKKACKNSPTGFHDPIPMPTKPICRFCSQNVNTFLSGVCLKSPHNGRHSLQVN